MCKILNLNFLKIQTKFPTFNIKIRPSLYIINGTGVFPHVFMHRLADCELMDCKFFFLILQDFNFVLLAFKDFLQLQLYISEVCHNLSNTYISFKAPFGLLIGFAEGTLENNLLVFQFFDSFIFQWNDPLIRFLKTK